MTQQMRQRIRFFAEHAGYATPPGRMACAKALATAEEWRERQEEENLRVTWDYDPEPYDLGDAEDRMPDEVLTCLVEVKCEKCGHWQPAASLCGIADPSNSDRRVIEAELCSEAMAAASAA